MANRLDNRYACDQCPYLTSNSTNLKRHRESAHQGVRYPCEQCEYNATRLSSLKRHIKNKHEGVRYPCDKCDYTSSDSSNLSVISVIMLQERCLV